MIDQALAESLGREVVAAIESRDWARLAACMSDDVVFRAVVANESRPFREHVGPEAASAQVARWFDDGDVHQLLGSGVDVVADRVHVRYRVRNREDGTWYVVEQHLFGTLAGDRIRKIDLLAGKDGQPPIDSDALAAYLDSRRPEMIAAVGLLGLLMLVWLMVMKPA